MDGPFNEIVQHCRKQKGWTIREFVEKLGGDISPAYITKIEVHNEIPSPELICKIAEVFKLNYQDLLNSARKNKVQLFDESLEKKYQKAACLYKLKK